MISIVNQLAFCLIKPLMGGDDFVWTVYLVLIYAHYSNCVVRMSQNYKTKYKHVFTFLHNSSASDGIIFMIYSLLDSLSQYHKWANISLWYKKIWLHHNSSPEAGPEPFFYLWMSKFLASEKRRYICIGFSHWLWPCPAKGRKPTMLNCLPSDKPKHWTVNSDQIQSSLVMTSFFLDIVIISFTI